MLMVSDFSCSLVKDTVPMHGRMYLTPSYVCFVSKLFKKKVCYLFLKQIIDLSFEIDSILFSVRYQVR